MLCYTRTKYISTRVILNSPVVFLYPISQSLTPPPMSFELRASWPSPYHNAAASPYFPLFQLFFIHYHGYNASWKVFLASERCHHVQPSLSSLCFGISYSKEFLVVVAKTKETCYINIHTFSLLTYSLLFFLSSYYSFVYFSINFTFSHIRCIEDVL